MTRPDDGTPTEARAIRERWSSAAAGWDAAQALPPEVLAWCGERGLLGATLPAAYGGRGLALADAAPLFESLGAVSGSLASIVNVQLMVAHSILRWGSAAQRDRWLPGLARGKTLAAFALTEQGAGSDFDSIECRCTPVGDKLRLQGRKTWVTTGGAADLFLVFARQEGAPVACLVERDTEGLRREPISDLLGLRAAHLARLELDCLISPDALLGARGFGLNVVASSGLLYGRLHVAWMACGILDATLTRTAAWTATRRMFGGRLADRGQVSQALARMSVDLRAARALCRESAALVEARDERMHDAVLAAKYFGCRAAAEHTGHAVRLHGGAGCHEPNDVARYYREAKVLEIIEGASEVIEGLLAARLAEGGRAE